MTQIDHDMACLGRPADDTGMTAWYVYVLLNDARIAYTGIAKSVASRLAQHNLGRGARFTRGRGPWRVVHVEGPMAHGEALRRESALKRDSLFKRNLKNDGRGCGGPTSPPNKNP